MPFLKLRELLYETVAVGRIIKNCVALELVEIGQSLPKRRGSMIWEWIWCRSLPQTNLIKDRNLCLGVLKR
jgi:hypothetical protein